MNLTLAKYIPGGETLTISVPASKSILNRALVLAAFCDGQVTLRCGTLGEDTRAMLGCLQALGIDCKTIRGGIEITGCNGNPPNKNAVLDVKSAGTAARFLTVALSFCGGEYSICSSEQMEKRPMDVLTLLEHNGVSFVWRGKQGAFPFLLRSDGLNGKNEFEIDTDVSTQYASGLLLSAPLKKQPVKITLTGSRTEGGYIGMTLALLRDFGVHYEKNGKIITVYPRISAPKTYLVEADISGACYFYALALLFKTRVFVEGVRLDSTQSDVKFLRLLEGKGVLFTQTENGLLGDATQVQSFTGFDADMNDFSDQVLTASALAPFATTPSRLKNIEHIKKQECDRINAVVENLTALGVPAFSDGKNIEIHPAPIKSGMIKTFGDHRVAMSFALIALKTGTVTIDDPDCCKKTFENYFEILKRLN